ncbi:uncharacterized protein J4E78_003863 [Alternaria triticimaculans]|uniref:uncharacterized protein n=1 Tax=Alternaria triticimaculans TaxID=297637 RepID=UPI0020C4721C|nr:uncharacterized protein J4E78_003863 [Alternaria triticimaculans]KAI4663449.1 hypothetical protein J4E78_003863 [Alternaria triticimaculans]
MRVEQGQLTQTLDDSNLIEQNKACTRLKSIELKQKRFSEARRRLSRETDRLLEQSHRLSEKGLGGPEASVQTIAMEEEFRSAIEANRVIDKILRGDEARMQNLAAEERAKVAMEGTHVKGRRRGLPLLLEAHGGLKEIMTCYDTGTYDNHMSRAKAIEFGYTIDPSPDVHSHFQLPNGKTIKAVGHVIVAVQFARQVGSEVASMTCRFNVFEHLALPVLIGMTFLQATETINKYTSRMVDLPGTRKRSLRLYSMGNATNQVSCIIEGRRISAAADTGSEIALISGTYARKRGLSIREGCEELELADGSLEYTSGFAYARISVLDRSHWEKRSTSISASKWKAKPGLRPEWIRFHVLECLQLDVLLDERTSDALDVFKNGFVEFMLDAPDVVPSISPIIHLGSVEASLARASDKCTSAFSKPASSSSAASTVSPAGPNDATSQARAELIPTLISQLDQAENRRLDQIEKRGASATDDTQKQRYELDRTKLLDELRGLNGTQVP